MGEKEHIDELLKESFSRFEPASPDVWSNISQQLGHQAVQAGAAAKIGTAIKSATLTTKVLIAIGIPALGLTGYAVYSNYNAKTNEPIVLIDTHPRAPEPAVQVAPEVEQAKDVQTVVKTEKKNSGRKAQPVNPVKPAGNNDQVTVNETVPVQEYKQELVKPTPVQPKTEVKPSPSRNVLKSSTRERMNRQATEPAKETVPVKLDSAPATDDVVIYNAISPDGDGKNDFFQVHIGEVSRFYLAIKDANGNMIFETDSKDSAWNGKHQQSGEDCKSGTYIYFLVYDLPDGKSHSKSGPILLIR